MHQIISGVHFLHKNSYYHCDLKPDNILMFKNKPVVADFGFTYEHGYNIGKKCGTPTYASPQCYNRLQKSDINNQECIQIQSDIFALGCIFFHLVTSEKLIPSDIKQIDTNYSDVENKIKKFINDENESERKEALECIYKMCRLDTNDRIKTLDEVLNQEIFINYNFYKINLVNMKSDLTSYLISKILLYNIHPIAELLKPIFKDFNNDSVFESCYEHIFNKYSNNFCYICHKTERNIYGLYDLYLCDSCFYYSNPNDDIYNYTQYELLEFRIIDNKNKYYL